MENFVDLVINHLPRLCSDHSPLLLSHRISFPAINLPFKFEAMWLSHVTFAKVVERSWAITCSGNHQFVMAQKLKILNHNLKVWNRENFGQLKVRISKANIAVLACQHMPMM